MARYLLKANTEVTSFKLFPDEKLRLKKAAEAQKLNLSEFIRNALSPWIQENTLSQELTKCIET